MTTVRLWADQDVVGDRRVAAVFANLRATGQSDFANTIWRGLANHPGPEFL